MSVAASVPGKTGADDRFRTLYKLLAELSRAERLQDVYEAALTCLFEATAADRAAILLFDEDGVIRFKASRGLSEEYQAAVTGHSPWPCGTRGVGPLVVPDVFCDEKLAAFKEVLQRNGIRAMAFVPLQGEAGVIGKFMLYYDTPHECSIHELEIAQAIAAHVALATLHKRAELAMIRSEQRLQAILDNSASVIFIKDLKGRYQLVNRRFEDLFHLTQTEVMGRTDREIFPAGIAERFQANDRQVLATEKPLAIEEYAPHDDGLHTYISMKFALQERDGRVTGVCGIATDITERKKLEAASRRLAALVESSADAIVGNDLNGIITSWNQGAERIFGYSAAEAVGKPISIIADPAHADEMMAILTRIRRGERVEHFETCRRRKDGQIIDVALSISPVFGSDGQIAGASKIARDISGRKEAEAERAQLLLREREARRTAELLNRVGPRLAAQLQPEKLAQEVTDIITVLVGAELGAFFRSGTDANGESGTFYSSSGIAHEKFSTFPIWGIDVSAPMIHEAVVRSDDITRDPRFENHPRGDQPGGDPPVRSYLTAPVISRSGEVLGRLFFGHSTPGKFTPTHEAVVAGIAAQAAIAMDNARLFTQGQWVQTELKRSNEELRRANRDLEVFAYSASHDLQEPLRNIAISAQLIERNVDPDALGESYAFLAEILTAARRMGVLLEDLLAYSRATRYEEGLPPTVDASRVLDEVLESLRRGIGETGAKVTSGKLPAVPIHESRLSQLFQNLISNSLKYRSQEVPRVHISAAERDGWLVFSVSDNGIGIDPQFAERIFGLFQRLHGRDEYPGSGIGLAICQRIVEQYGGRIWLEQSALGQGSTFSFALPANARY